MSSTRLFCFDVFDTTLTRLVGEPVSLFFLLGQRLCSRGLISRPAAEFLQARVEAERRVRSQGPQREATLADIWNQLASDLELPLQLAQQCLEQELHLEEEMIRLVPSAKKWVTEARQKGKVAFISDMYLPAAFIKRQLEKYELWGPECSLYVSCEHGCSKADGSLFRSLLEKEGVKTSEAHHVGNDPISDVQGAKLANIKSTLQPDCALNRYERILQGASSQTQAWGALLAGASRVARLQAGNQEARARVLWEVACGVAAPTLVTYLRWVFKRARDLNIERLYFVSRDGQILLEIAQALSTKWKLGLELRYLYGSRQAWHLPAVSEITDRELAWILAETTFLSIETALSRVGLQPEEIAATLLKAGFDRQQWQRNLSKEQRRQLADLLRESSVASRIVQEGKKYRGTLLRYLEQEGFMGSSKSAIVDVGWTGRMFDSMTIALDSVGASAPYAFYFGLVGQGRKGAPRTPREAFYVDTYQDKNEPVPLPQRAAILEMFCAGDHGQVRGYVEQDGIVKPSLKEATNMNVMDWGLPEFRQAVRTFVDALSCEYFEATDFEPFARMVGQVLTEFWERPSYEEARVWGAFPYFDDQTEAYWNPLAQPCTMRDAVCKLRGLPFGRHVASWPAGSAMLSSRPMQTALWLASKCAPIYWGAARRTKSLLPARFRPDAV